MVQNKPMRECEGEEINGLHTIQGARQIEDRCYNFSPIHVESEERHL